MYKATSKNKIITQNETILPDGFSSIVVKNIGDTPALVNDNIPLAAGAVHEWRNDPDVRIDETTFLKFVPAGGEVKPKLLIVKYYYK